LHLFTGSNGLSVGHPAILDNDEPDPGFSWITMAEILEEEHISWRVYQEQDNFDDNAFAWFESFMIAKPGNPLYDKGIAPVPDLVSSFKQDLESGKLPQVRNIIFWTHRIGILDYRPSSSFRTC
jgi:phospholipase C